MNDKSCIWNRTIVFRIRQHATMITLNNHNLLNDRLILSLSLKDTKMVLVIMSDKQVKITKFTFSLNLPEQTFLISSFLEFEFASAASKLCLVSNLSPLALYIQEDRRKGEEL
jgi:hypothetical protein